MIDEPGVSIAVPTDVVRSLAAVTGAVGVPGSTDSFAAR